MYWILALVFSFQTIEAFVPMDQIYHPVSTNNPEVQKKFDRGLTYVYAYNHDLAFQNFEEAAALEPALAMAYWGMALALGQNINQDVTPENEKRAFAYSQKALELAPNATKPEQAYINALSVRYTDDPNGDLVKLRFLYRDAMKKVKDTYSEDLDAAVLYTESILNLDPWKYWTWDGKPKDGTEEAIEILKSVLIRNPDHIGANHFYIHAWEESPTPQNALMSAFRLTELYKEAGHLVHMPCHIFLPCGYYKQAIATSKNAIKADYEYIKDHGMEGDYPLHYLTHNLKILARVYMLSEDYDNAMKTAKELIDFVAPYSKGMPHLSNATLLPLDINLYFKRYKEVLEAAAPPADNFYAQSYYHFARANAFIHLGDLENFKKERDSMLKLKEKIPSTDEVANNKATQIIVLAEMMLDAYFQKDTYIEKLKKAVDFQDRLYYDEPPAWYTAIRLELGESLLEEKRYVEAEAVFRKALVELQRNGRLLNGLFLSLQGQERTWDAKWVERESAAAGF